nr:MAG TPA: hypothetical protein [Caudoviricetes sp.]
MYLFPILIISSLLILFSNIVINTLIQLMRLAIIEI